MKRNKNISNALTAIDSMRDLITNYENKLRYECVNRRPKFGHFDDRLLETATELIVLLRRLKADNAIE